MKDICVIIPTYKRAHRLPSFIYNFQKNSTRSTLYFVITPDDLESKEYLEKVSQNYFVYDGEYVASVNYGFLQTKEPFVLFAADDVEFRPNWERLLDLFDDNTHIVGGVDSWEISKSMKHISHPLFRREYIKSTPYDTPYNPDYVHYMCDIEFVQRGFKDNAVKIIPEILIEHYHPYMKTAPQDDTYSRSIINGKNDKKTYDAIKKDFEMYDFEALSAWGRVVPTKLNPEYDNTLLSIVIPAYNAKNYLQRTLETLFANTYYRFELIIIDDNSKQETQDFIKSIETPEVALTRIYNDKQKWVNYNWNLGVKRAVGTHIAVLNSDIELEKDWDKFLVDELRRSTVACPYEKNSHSQTPYALTPLFEKYCPNMIKGACFMFKAEDRDKLFPIPDNIKHWCGDNIIADRAQSLGGTSFVKQSVFYHYVSKSGATVKKQDYLKRIKKDVDEYEKMSGNNMDWLRHVAFGVVPDSSSDKT